VIYDEIAKQTPRSNPGPGQHNHTSSLSTQVCRLVDVMGTFFGFVSVPPTV
jgi:hypothetical protein